MTSPSIAYRVLATAVAAAALTTAGCSATHPSAAHTAPPLATTTPTKTPAPDMSGPQWYAVMQHGHVQWYDSHTGASLGTSGGPSDYAITAIASWHDNRSVVYAAKPLHSNACRSLLGRQRVDSPNGLTNTDVPHLVNIHGIVEHLSISPDRTKAALVLRAGYECQQEELTVVDLRTGAQRTWTMPYSESKSAAPGYGDGYFVDLAAWAPDDRHLVVHYAQCCASGGGIWVLDSHAAPGSLLKRLPALPKNESCMQSLPYAWAPQGVVTDGQPCGGTNVALTIVDPATGIGKPLVMGSLGAVSDVSPDPSGNHLLVYGDQTVYRVDNGVVRRLMSLPWDTNSPPTVAW